MNVIEKNQHQGFTILVSLLAKFAKDEFPKTIKLNYDDFVENLELIELESFWYKVWQVRIDTINWLENEGYIKIWKINFGIEQDADFEISFSPTKKWLNLLGLSFTYKPYVRENVISCKNGNLIIKPFSIYCTDSVLPIEEPASSFISYYYYYEKI
ncbi:hypothetical protein [Pseudoalteromonas sp. PB2-1]|uniref:hypothetical protein n=1 Tax=Pseudoalteromonas sp. PB2-1 TaxID=2907242 RepID=UPI003869F638